MAHQLVRLTEEMQRCLILYASAKSGMGVPRPALDMKLWNCDALEGLTRHPLWGIALWRSLPNTSLPQVFGASPPHNFETVAHLRKVYAHISKSAIYEEAPKSTSGYESSSKGTDPLISVSCNGHFTRRKSTYGLLVRPLPSSQWYQAKRHMQPACKGWGRRLHPVSSMQPPKFVAQSKSALSYPMNCEAHPVVNAPCPAPGICKSKL